MKLVSFLFVFSFGLLHAQDITGSWYGILNVQTLKLNMEFVIQQDSNTFKAFLNVPDQGVAELPLDKCEVNGTEIKMIFASADMKFNGIWDKQQNIKGTFSQAGMEIPMDLSRIKPQKAKHPQEPIPPFPYASEEVKFKTLKGTHELAGTLTYPKGQQQLTAIILFSGSGADNRNEEMLGHKHFLLLSDYLTRQGYAVLRYDDRGVGISGGTYAGSTTLDLTEDAVGAFDYLSTRPEINPSKIGVIGHSEGAMIAQLLIAQYNRKAAFMISLGGPGISGDQILLLQNRLISEASGTSSEELDKMDAFNKKLYHHIMKAKSPKMRQEKVTAFLHKTYVQLPDSIKKQVSETQFTGIYTGPLLSPWMVYFLKYEPAHYLEKITCPVLAINGEKDLQVPCKVNLQAIGDALSKAGNKDFKLLAVPNINHLMQTCKTGLPAEYAQIEETIAPIVLINIAEWIKKHP